MIDVSERPTPCPPTAPVKKSPFLPGETIEIRRLGRLEETDLTVYIFRDVLEELIFASAFQPALTTTGILTGGFYRGPAGEYVEVRGYQDTAVVDTTRQFAERLRSDWEQLWRDRSLRQKGLLPLGWFVSRPGCAAKPGPFELITHLSYFNLRYQLFAMLDPLSRVLGVYRRLGQQRLENIAFNLIQGTTPRKEQRDAAE